MGPKPKISERAEQCGVKTAMKTADLEMAIGKGVAQKQVIHFLPLCRPGNTIREGDLLLIDVGFENEMMYAGDLSSTIPAGKKFTPEQKEIYQFTF